MRRCDLTFRDRRQIRGENHEEREAGWHNSETFVQTELKRPNDLSAEVREVMQAMQINALRREQALVAHFEKRLAAKAAPL